MFGNGLSLEQAPPINVVLRFFLAVPFFGIIFSSMLIYFGSNSLVPHSSESLILIHTFFLGIITMSMLGAMFQMLPVLAGVVIKTSVYSSKILYILFLAIIFSLIGYFFNSMYSIGILTISFIIMLFIYIVNIFIFKLWNQKGDTVVGIKVALIFFVSTLILAILLLQANISGNSLIDYLQLKHIHFSFALFGWVGMLIIAIAYQVIEMFFVTPQYPKICKKYLWLVLVLTLLLDFISNIYFQEYKIIFDSIVALIFFAFAIVTLRRLSQRKRPTQDITIWFWKLGMLFLILSLILWVSFKITSNQILQPFILISYSFFALSVVFSMMYKIVPFLVWFHLTNKGIFDAPLMNEIITKKQMKLHFYLFILLSITLSMTLIIKEFIFLSGGLSLLLFITLGYNLFNAQKIYKKNVI